MPEDEEGSSVSFIMALDPFAPFHKGEREEAERHRHLNLRKCPLCGQVISKTRMFCIACGAEQVAPE